ncbi:uncharacterized protein DFL_006777 [Arthrobotrys flagrans]|uniref:NADAR domain-containing protein n=1 Tax=Arthrobotrys flagrans TaxID=97331 RepID=A0A436ZTS2_ARTFL|nr:hypothetical protein DFL_006777 [Arthrobotrys flagrans]
MAASSSSTNNAQIDTDNGIYFWKPDQRFGYLGQWYASPFTVDSEDGTCIQYENCEQYMMHRKGVLFAPDSDATRDILAKGLHPAQIKALGRAIPNFDEDTWESNRYNIVKQGNYHKFTQNKKLKEMLLETGNKELVEASPRDRIWGVGYGAVNAPKNRRKWGMNLLGKALMEIRETIREEEKGKEEKKAEEVH